MGCADAAKGQTLADKINGVTAKRSAIACKSGLDLGSTQSINAWSDELQQILARDGERLESLIHHAGAMGLGKFTPTADGDEMQWAMNALGPFKLTQRLWKTIVSDATKVVCLTSSAHATPSKPFDFAMACHSEAGYHGWGAYQQSKLAALLLSNELQRRLAATGSGADSRAVCENDKWFYLPQLLLPDDKAELAAGPATTIAALSGLGEGGSYLADSKVGTPGEHGRSESDARKLWEMLMAKV